MFRSNDAAKWLAYYQDHYDACVKQSEHPMFIKLDGWAFGTGPKDLPALVQKQQYMTSAQLSGLMQYKLLRGKWRPRLQMYVDGLDDDLVVECTREAFELAGEDDDFDGAFKELSKKEMKGVGPVR